MAEKRLMDRMDGFRDGENKTVIRNCTWTCLGLPTSHIYSYHSYFIYLFLVFSFLSIKVTIGCSDSTQVAPFVAPQSS